jgi:hypothetical protein
MEPNHEEMAVFLSLAGWQMITRNTGPLLFGDIWENLETGMVASTRIAYNTEISHARDK